MNRKITPLPATPADRQFVELRKWLDSKTGHTFPAASVEPPDDGSDAWAMLYGDGAAPPTGILRGDVRGTLGPVTTPPAWPDEETLEFATSTRAALDELPPVTAEEIAEALREFSALSPAVAIEFGSLRYRETLAHFERNVAAACEAFEVDRKLLGALPVRYLGLDVRERKDVPGDFAEVVYADGSRAPL